MRGSGPWAPTPQTAYGPCEVTRRSYLLTSYGYVVTTESNLREWRHGSTSAERLCAGILTIEGYTHVDPQAPLGGPDDKKDILCRRQGRRVVAAVYFPPTPQDFSSIKSKFVSDYQGAARHHAEEFVFFVNQPLTLEQRKELVVLGEGIEIYHLERLRSVLDAPPGYGLRLEYLRIQMTMEDQIAFFSSYNRQHDASPDDAPRSDLGSDRMDTALARTGSVLGPTGIGAPPSTLGEDVYGAIDSPSSELTVSTLKFLHRAVMSCTPGTESVAGQLRAIRVWVGPADTPIYTPPDPDLVPDLLAELLRDWRDQYPALVAADRQRIVHALARLHHRLLAIHPFVDGNGRLARMITDQAARELLGRAVSIELVHDRDAYFNALHSADLGDFSALEDLIRVTIE